MNAVRARWTLVEVMRKLEEALRLELELERRRKLKRSTDDKSRDR